MKFGKFFRRNIEAIVAAGQSSAGNGAAPPFLPYKEMKQFIGVSLRQGEKQAQLGLGQARLEFIKQLDQSVKEIEDYYVARFLEFQDRVHVLTQAVTSAEDAAQKLQDQASGSGADAEPGSDNGSVVLNELRALNETARHLLQDMNTLKMYASLNEVAVIKIAKKFDKSLKKLSQQQQQVVDGEAGSPTSMPLQTRYELKLKELCFAEHPAFQKLTSIAGKLSRRVEDDLQQQESLQGSAQIRKEGSEEQEDEGRHHIRLPRRRQHYGEMCGCACISFRQLMVLTFSLLACLAAVMYVAFRFFFTKTILIYVSMLVLPIALAVVISAWIKAVDDASRAAELNSQTFSPLTTTQLLLLIPTNIASRIWGIMHSTPLPRLLRKPSYLFYSYIFGCILDEVRYPLDTFKSLGEFFCRPLKDDARFVEMPTEEESAKNAFIFNSPVDGKIVALGDVIIDEETGDAKIEQIKGLDYSLNDFLGLSREELLATLRRDGNTKRKLRQCVIYLAPGDYHRIHSPISWNIVRRMHFPGCLLPVNPIVVKFVRGLFAMNERVVLEGEYCRSPVSSSFSPASSSSSPASAVSPASRTVSPTSPRGTSSGSEEAPSNDASSVAAADYCRFYFVAVGALNVGGIELSFDKEVRTNNNWKPRVRSLPQPSLKQKVFSMNRRRVYRKLLEQAEPYGEGSSYHQDYSSFGGIQVEVGEEIAHFKLGSTVVLIWEMEDGADDCQSFVRVGEKVRVGQKLFTISRTAADQ